MHTELSVKNLKTKDLLKLFFEKAQRSFASSSNIPKDLVSKLDMSLSPDEETEMYIMYEELQLRAGEYDRMKAGK